MFNPYNPTSQYEWFGVAGYAAAMASLQAVLGDIFRQDNTYFQKFRPDSYLDTENPNWIKDKEDVEKYVK